MGAEEGAGAEEAGFGAGDGDPQQMRNGWNRQFIEVVVQGGAVERVDASDCVAHELAPFGEPVLGFGIGEMGNGEQKGGEGGEGNGASAAEGAEVHFRLADDDFGEPGRESGVVAELVEVEEGFEEGDLDLVFGIGGIAQQVADEREAQGAVFLGELSEGLVIAAARPFHQFTIGWHQNQIRHSSQTTWRDAAATRYIPNPSADSRMPADGLACKRIS